MLPSSQIQAFFKPNYLALEFWKLAAIITWVLVGTSVLLFLYLKKRWLNFGKEVFLGQRLHTSVDRLFEEIEERKVSKKTLSKVAKHVLWRFTRIGLFAIIAAFIPVVFIAVQSYLLSNQNQLLLSQNERIEIQNNLLEADRRSSLVFLMSNILDKVDEEIRNQRTIIINTKPVNDSDIRYPLSPSLLGRVVALSRSFKPYRVLEDNVLSQKLRSPERGQLFIALVESDLDSNSYRTIFENGDFSYASIGKMMLSNIDLSGANLKGVDLSGANLYKAKLIGTNLSEAELNNTDFEGADLHGANLSRSNLSNSILRQTNLAEVNLTKTNLTEAFLEEANFWNAFMDGANLKNVHFGPVKESYLNSTKPSYVKTDTINGTIKKTTFWFSGGHGASRAYDTCINLTIQQLMTVHSIHNSIGLTVGLEKEIKENKPCLFEERGCNQ